MKFIIIDWMGNVCFGSQLKDFNTIEEASEWLDYCLRLEYNHICKNEECLCDSMGEEGSTLEELREEFYFEPYDEKLDRIMCVGLNYVLKKNYYDVIGQLI